MTSPAQRPRPSPKPGISDIAPYVPGKSGAKGARVLKLSSNETPLGPSPRAIEAFAAAAKTLALYPDGAANDLREAIAQRYGLNAARIVCGAGSDELLQLLAHAYLGPGDEAIYSQYGFLVYPIAIKANGATAVVAPERDLHADVDAILARVTAKTRIVFLANPNNPTGTYLPFDEVKRLHAGLPGDCLLVLDAAYAEYVRRNDYEAGIELVSHFDNVVMTRTFSKIHGLAALAARLGLLPGACRRCAQPHSRALQCLGPGPRRRRRRRSPIATSPRQAIAHNDQWLAWLTSELAALGLTVTPSVGNFLLVHFPKDQRRNAPAADEFLTNRGIVLRRMEAYGLPGALAPHHRSMKRPIAPSSRHWRSSCDDHAAFQARGIDRSWSHRLLAQPCHPRRKVWPNIFRAMRRSEATRAKAVEIGLVDSMHESAAAAVADADLVILCIPVGACGEVAREIGPSLKEGAIITDVGSVKTAIVRDVVPHLPANVHFMPGPSRGGHRAIRPRIRLRRTLRQSLVHPHALAEQRPRRGEEARGILARLRLQCRDDDAGAPRSGARHHQPSAASHRLQYRGDRGRCRGSHQFRSHQILRRRLSRLHAHRRVGSDHVARRLPQQQGRRARNARAASRRTCRCFSAPSAGAMARLCINLFTRSRQIRRSIIAAGQETAAPTSAGVRQGQATGRQVELLGGEKLRQIYVCASDYPKSAHTFGSDALEERLHRCDLERAPIDIAVLEEKIGGDRAAARGAGKHAAQRPQFHHLLFTEFSVLCNSAMKRSRSLITVRMRPSRSPCGVIVNAPSPDIVSSPLLNEARVRLILPPEAASPRRISGLASADKGMLPSSAALSIANLASSTAKAMPSPLAAMSRIFVVSRPEMKARGDSSRRPRRCARPAARSTSAGRRR